MRLDHDMSRRQRRPHGWGSPLGVLGLLLLLVPTVSRAQGASPDTVRVVWTAPGDDGRIGTAADYELRVSTSPINANNWDQATPVTGTPRPLIAGTRQSMVVRGLTPGTTYWLAIKAVDDAGNWSDISNVLKWDWVYDHAPPSSPGHVTTARQEDGSVRVSWPPNPEPDLAGYNVYRALDASGPFVLLNTTLVTATEYLDTTLPAGTQAAWYQVTARDDAGNESAHSSTATAEVVAQAGTWTMETGYPNPSSAGAIVRIPLVAPSSGKAAVVEITNNAGLRVRRIDLGVLPPGPTAVQWDGKNDSGREVAPGPYTAWLISASTRLSVRLVRVP